MSIVAQRIRKGGALPSGSMTIKKNFHRKEKGKKKEKK